MSAIGGRADIGRAAGFIGVSQAMATNVTKRLWEIGDIVDVLEAWEQSQTKVARHDTQETR
jgi:hypothetical protein